MLFYGTETYYPAEEPFTLICAAVDAPLEHLKESAFILTKIHDESLETGYSSPTACRLATAYFAHSRFSFCS